MKLIDPAEEAHGGTPKPGRNRILRRCFAGILAGLLTLSALGAGHPHTGQASSSAAPVTASEPSGTDLVYELSLATLADRLAQSGAPVSEVGCVRASTDLDSAALCVSLESIVGLNTYNVHSNSPDTGARMERELECENNALRSLSMDEARLMLVGTFGNGVAVTCSLKGG